VLQRLSLSREVTDPDGRRWIVQRRLAPRVRWRKVEIKADPFDSLMLIDDYSLSGIVAGFLLGLLVVVLGAVLILVLLPALALLGELLLVPALFLLGRIFIVQARTDGPPVDGFRVRQRGWRRSAETVREVAEAIAGGDRHGLTRTTDGAAE
jgi:hypothetical protein